MHVERISTCVFARVSNSSIRFEVLPHVIGFNFATKMILQCMFCKEITQCVLFIQTYIYFINIYQIGTYFLSNGIKFEPCKKAKN